MLLKCAQVTSQVPGKRYFIISILRRFLTLSLNMKEICLLPEPFEDEDSFCGLIERSYRYDEGSEMCVEFVDNGCGGNDNNFKSLKKCVEFCGAKNSLVPPGNLSHSLRKENTILNFL